MESEDIVEGNEFFPSRAQGEIGESLRGRRNKDQ